jgi:hypothetical protein
VLLSFFVSTARATERQWHLGAGLGAATATSDAVGWGPAVEVHAAYGINDLFDVRAMVSGSRHTLTYAEGVFEESGNVLTASAGLTYKLDIIEWVPYFGVMAGYQHSDVTPLDGVVREHDLMIAGVAGLDYAVSREFGLGVRLGAHWTTEGALWTSGFFRAEYRWGF